MATFTTADLFNRVIIRNAQWSANVTRDVTDASVVMEVDRVTQLDISIDDPGFSFLRESNIPLGAPVEFEGLRLAMSSIETVEGGGEGGIRLQARPMVVHKLKKRRGTMVTSNLSPSQWVSREVEAVGGKAVVQASNKKSQIARDVPPKGKPPSDEFSSWSTIKRLADEVGYVAYESNGVVYFGKPTWLVKRNPVHRVLWGSDPGDRGSVRYATTIPQCRRSIDDNDGRATVRVTVDPERARDFRPGDVLRLEGVPRFKGDYFITEVSFDIAQSDQVTVSAETPHDPDPTGKSS